MKWILVVHYLKFRVFAYFFVFFIFSCSRNNSLRFDQRDFHDILDVKNIPAAPLDRDANCFFDLGSWHGFALLPDSAKSLLGGFSGPFLMTEWRWLSKSLVVLTLEDADEDTVLDLSESQVIRNEYIPGQLLQTLVIGDIEIHLRLCFANSNTALIHALIKNKGQSGTIRSGWRGQLFLRDAKLQTTEKQIEVHLPQRESIVRVDFSEHPGITVNEDGKSYTVTMPPDFHIAPGRSISHSVAVSFFENNEQKNSQQKGIDDLLKDPDKVFNENTLRWNNYLNRILSKKTEWSSTAEYRDIAVKCLLTLVNNWKSPLGDLKHGGIIPSYNIDYFTGFWAWDSWKHAVAVVHFEPELAKDQVFAMFDFQDETGMVADCIYPDKNENNWRDTKPPLAAWAVWEIFKETKDKEFIREIFPKLVKYHQWWYKNRDHDENGLCEYGSTDGTIIAARWESGMDNAVRFDNSKMLKNNNDAWSMDQESVDLNSYLYAEKIYLAKMAYELQNYTEAERLEETAAKLKVMIQSKMFNDENGYFHDVRIVDGSFVDAEGPEGWIPLWCEAAGREQADRVLKVMTDSSRFATFVPFPTVSKSHAQFSDGYWRGPVWLDQVYFAIKGLKNYGYLTEAQKFTQQIFDRAQGLKNSAAPVRENYNALTGEGMRVRHFSWSAAHLLLLYLER